MRAGIDFGTSNTAIAAVHGNDVRLTEIEPGETSIPTAIFYEAGTRSFTIGNAALEIYSEGEEGRLMRSIKSILGTELIEDTTQLDGRRIPFQKVISDFLARSIHQIEKSAQDSIDLVVQGRPVSFNDTDPARDKRAQDVLENCLKEIGVKDVSFMPEPVAAAHSVDFPVGRENLAFVVDIGGGTSDFSVVRVSDDNEGFDVLASSGVYLGGNDFDRILSYFELTPLFGRLETLSENGLPVPVAPYVTLSDWKSHNMLYLPNMRREIDWLIKHSPQSPGLRAFDHLIRNFEGGLYASKVEQMKIDLSSAETAEFKYKVGRSELSHTVAQAAFNGLIAETMEAMDVAAQACLKSAGVTHDQVTDILMVGGSTLIPAVERHFVSQFAHATMLDNDRFSAVAKGLARHAATL